MQKAHQNINWENKPSTDTPINETNLNLMDRSIDTIDDRVVTFDTTKANQSDILQAVRNISYDDSTGTFTISFFNGTSTTIDTDIEKIPVNFDYDGDPTSPHYQQLILELDDGTYKYIDLSALITEYEFEASDTIAPSVTGGVISMDIIDGTVTGEKLQPNYLADVTAQAQASASAASSASSSKQDSEAWAVGTRNGAPVQYGDPAYQNNAKYYAQHGVGTSFAGLADTDFNDLASGQVPIYDANTQLWKNGTPEAGILPKLIITGEAGSTITILSPSLEQITPTSISATVWSADVKEYGDYLITATKSGSSVQKTVSVNVVQVYNVTMAFFEAFINVTFPDDATVSCSAPDQETQYATTSPYIFTVNASATYTITGTRSGITETQTVVITTSGQTEYVTLEILPDGSTVTPINDVQTLLHCADIWDKTTYTTIADLIADDTSLLTVLTNDNAIDYLVRSTTFASAITADEDAMAMIGSYDYASDTLLADATWGLAILNSTYVNLVLNIKNPIMTSNTTPKGQVVASSEYNASYAGWKAFDGLTNDNHYTTVGASTSAYYLGYIFDTPKKIIGTKVTGSGSYGTGYYDVAVYGGDDLSSLSKLSNDIRISGSTASQQSAMLNNDTEKSTYVFKVEASSSGATHTSGSTSLAMVEIEFYGREDGGVQSWLRAGGITDKDYTTLAEVLADTTTLSALIADHDAVDYLVTAKGLIDGIVADATAMSYIGLNNYCANTLLGVLDWKTAINDSTYSLSVLNAKVPSMTDYNQPSGIVSATTENANTAYRAWKAFDGNASTSWVATDYTATNQRLVYDFGHDVLVTKASVRPTFISPTARLKNIIIQGSSDGTTWNDFDEYLIPNVDQNNDYDVLEPTTPYRYWAIFCVDCYGTTMGCAELQFYGREDV